jgi:hypothetical protein
LDRLFKFLPVFFNQCLNPMTCLSYVVVERQREKANREPKLNINLFLLISEGYNIGAICSQRRLAIQSEICEFYFLPVRKFHRPPLSGQGRSALAGIQASIRIDAGSCAARPG